MSSLSKISSDRYLCQEQDVHETSDLKPLHLKVKELCPKLTLIDEEVWRKHISLEKWNIDFVGLAHKSIEEIVEEYQKTMSELEKNGLAIDGDAGITIMAVGRNLSPDVMQKMAAEPKEGYPVPFWGKNWDCCMVKNYGEKGADKPYWVLLTNANLKNSFCKTSEEHEEIVNKAGLKIPLIPDMLALMHMTHVVFKRCLFSQGIFARCSEYDSIQMRERFDGVNTLGLGSFSSNGFYILGAKQTPEMGVAGARIL